MEDKEEGSIMAACDAQWVIVGEKLHFVGNIFNVYENASWDLGCIPLWAHSTVNK